MMKKEGGDNFFQKYKKWIIVVGLLLLLFLVVFGAQIYLFINFFLGNDIIIKVSTEQESVNITRGEAEKVTFKVGVTTNPFCQALCIGEFKDLSEDNVLKQEEFTLTAGIQQEKDFIIKSDVIGKGFSLYSYQLSCHGIKSFLCHTDSTPTTRTIVVTAASDLSNDEKELFKTLNEKLKNFLLRGNKLERNIEIIGKTVATLNVSVDVDSLQLLLEQQRQLLEKFKEDLASFKKYWEIQQYYVVAEKLNAVSLEDVELNFNTLNDNFLTTFNSYNSLIDQITAVHDQLHNFTADFPITSSIEIFVNETKASYNTAEIIMKQRNQLSLKQEAVNDLATKYDHLVNSTTKEREKWLLEKAIHMDVAKDVLCALNGVCLDHLSVENRSQEMVNKMKTCSEINSLWDNYIMVNDSLKEAFNLQNYPLSDSFDINGSVMVHNLEIEKMNQFRLSIPENRNNSILLQEILKEQEKMIVTVNSYYNLTPFLVTKIREIIPLPCKDENISLVSLPSIIFKPVVIENASISPWEIYFDEPQLKCCIKRNCDPCCKDQQCSGDPQFYPVVFLHGHAFNQDVSAEYSLDAFNQLQEKLEKEGYLNVGAISLYTKRDTPLGVWGLFKVPLLIKASYYYDVFQTPDNYVVVQQKSENIDTYAVRLKELLDTISYKTGRPRVVVIAHSMGGLVARRYMQLFGTEKIAKLIMIATPHKGVEDDVYNFCNVIGSELECRDMKAGSVFLNKLNSGNIPKIPLYVILGSGCTMEHGEGDGVVVEEKAKIEEAKLFYVKGTCTKLNPLHTQLLNLDLYPEVYDLVKKALED